MVVITVEAYQNAHVHTIAVKNKDLFWVKMKDVQDGLGVKNIIDFLRKEMWGNFETNNLTREQTKKYIRSEYEITKNPRDSNWHKYVRSDIMEKIIKNCRGVKKTNRCVNRL